MGDTLNRMYNWGCPTCGTKLEETDVGQLEVRIQTHRCKVVITKDPYLEELLSNKSKALRGKG